MSLNHDNEGIDSDLPRHTPEPLIPFLVLTLTLALIAWLFIIVAVKVAMAGFRWVIA